MPDSAFDIPLIISQESDNAAKALIDELIYDLLDREPEEIKRSLLAGETSADYEATSRWYNRLPQPDRKQVTQVIHLSIEHTLSMILMLLDHGKFFAGPGSGDAEEVLHYGLYAEMYPEPSLYQESQPPLSRIPINPLRYYELRLSDMLTEKLRERHQTRETIENAL